MGQAIYEGLKDAGIRITAAADIAKTLA